MARGGIIGSGIIILFIAFIGYIVPVNNAGNTSFQMNTLCETDLFQFGQLFDSEISAICSASNLIIIGTYATAIIGIVLVIIGVVIPKSFKGKTIREKPSALDILEKRYAKGEITKEEFDEMKEDLA